MHRLYIYMTGMDSANDSSELLQSTHVNTLFLSQLLHAQNSEVRARKLVVKPHEVKLH